MKRNILVNVSVAVAAALCLSAAVRGEEAKKVNVIYFGNSFTGNTMPGLHPELGRSVGKEWVPDMLGGPGQPPWTHMMRLIRKDPKFKSFWSEAPTAEMMVTLIFGGTGAHHIVSGEKWGHKFDQPTDIGDVAACEYLIDNYLKLNPKGRAYIYTAWPGIPAIGEFRKRVQTEQQIEFKGKGLSDAEVMKKVKEAQLPEDEMQKIRKAFDYPATWLAKDYIGTVPDGIQERLSKYLGVLRPKLTDATPVKLADLVAGTKFAETTVKGDLKAFRLSETLGTRQQVMDGITRYQDRIEMTHSRPHMYAVMDALIAKYPVLWKEGRLGMVPVGDVFLALDQKIKAGKIPGLTNVGEFISNGHLRSGMPRYVLAATHYAVLFQDDPNHLDWKIFDDVSNYESKKFGFYVHQPDLGVHIDIAPPDRAEVVNDTIWEVVAGHPYTQVRRDRKP